MSAKRRSAECREWHDETRREPTIRPGNRPGGFAAGYCVTSDIRAVDTATDCPLRFSGPDGAMERANGPFNYASEFDH